VLPLTTWKLVAGVEPKVTAVTPLKPLPLRVIWVPGTAVDSDRAVTVAGASV
jgi:hypothetical protein